MMLAHRFHITVVVKENLFFLGANSIGDDDNISRSKGNTHDSGIDGLVIHGQGCSYAVQWWVGTEPTLHS